MARRQRERERERERERPCLIVPWNTGGSRKHICLRVYVHPENDIVDLKAAAQWMSYTRFSLPETQSKGIGWALKPGGFDRSPCPGEGERERETLQTGTCTSCCVCRMPRMPSIVQFMRAFAGMHNLSAVKSSERGTEALVRRVHRRCTSPEWHGWQ